MPASLTTLINLTCFADKRSTMSEPAKDTALEITPKTETPPVRLPRIVAEINRVASRVRERKKKEEDAEVLENDAPTPSPKPMEITRIIRENTHPRHSSANGCLRSLCYLGLLTALIYVCLILHDVRRFLHKLNNISVSSQLRSLDETLTNLSGNLTTSIADLETTVVNISDSISNVTQVNSFIQETFFSFTGDVTLEETLVSLGDTLVRNVKWKKLGDTLTSEIQWDKVLASFGNGLTNNVKWKKLGDILGDEIQWEKIVNIVGKAMVRKMDLDNLSRKDESTGVRYLNTRGPGCTEGTCSGWVV